MRCAGDHDSVETYSPDRADQTIRMGILPRPGCDRVIAYTVAIADEMQRRLLPRERLGQLTSLPLRCGMRSGADKNKIASGDADDDEAIQQTEAAKMVDEKRGPSLRFLEPLAQDEFFASLNRLKRFRLGGRRRR